MFSNLDLQQTDRLNKSIISKFKEDNKEKKKQLFLIKD